MRLASSGRRLREAPGDHCSHAKLLGRERCVLARGALPVVLPSHYESASPLTRPLREVRVDTPEDEFRHRGDVRAECHHLGSVGRKVPGGDIIPHDQDAPFEFFRQGSFGGRWLPRWPRCPGCAWSVPRMRPRCSMVLRTYHFRFRSVGVITL